MIAKLLPLITPHHIYVEPFGGGASLLFAKPPSPVEVYNDLNEGLVNLFRVLRDPEQFAEFHRLVSLTPYSRAEFNYCRDNWQEQGDPVQRAYQFYAVARMSFSGRFGSGFSSALTSSRRGMVDTASQWLSIIEQLPEIHTRLMRVQIECQDWRTILERYDMPETLFYLDPPYMPDTRSDKRYEHELTAEDHTELVDRLLGIQGQAILSGYDHPVYQPLTDAGWARKEWQTACYAAGRTRATGILGDGASMAMRPRTEVVWCKTRQLQLPLFG